MRVVVRSLWIVVLAIASTVGLAVAWTTATAAQLLATALIMGGTDHPLSTPPDDPVTYINPYMGNAVTGFINPAAAAPFGGEGDGIDGVAAGDDRYAVIYPAEFFPIFGSQTFDASVAEGFENLNNCVRGDGCVYNEDPAIDPGPPVDPPIAGDDFVIFGYSQSAVVASQVKQDLIDNPPPAGTTAWIFLLANPERPNGGFLSRGPEGLTIPFLGVTFSDGTPTNSCEVGPCIETFDAVAQYDGLGGDAAVSLTNLPAVINAALGYYYLHGDLQNASLDDAVYQGSFGDTDYYLFPTPRLPVLMPFEGIVPSPILTALDTIIRPVIEGGYAHDVNPGIATKVGLLPFRNPVQTLLNVIAAIPTGIDDAIAEATNDPTNRPLGTAPVTSPFGVGGPELPDPPSALNLTALADSARAGDNDPAGQDTSEVQSLGADDPDADETGNAGESAVEGEGEDAIEDAREEEAIEEEADETTGGTDIPEAGQPETPSGEQPGDGVTTGDEPDSGQDDAGGQAAA